MTSLLGMIVVSTIAKQVPKTPQSFSKIAVTYLKDCMTTGNNKQTLIILRNSLIRSPTELQYKALILNLNMQSHKVQNKNCSMQI